MEPSRRTALAALLAGLLVVAAVVLESVLSTVVFAVTVAYVLYPLREWVTDRGYPDRVAAGTATVAGFLGVVALAAPLAYVLYRRRRDLLAFIAAIPDEVVVDLGPFTYVVETAIVFVTAQATLRGLAISLASAAPVIALKLVVFVTLVYGLLFKPRAPRVALLRLCPGEYHDVLLALHRRTASTLRAIYVLQGATAVATFVVALVTFAALGYQSPFALAVVAGVLQFVPVLGPSVVVVALAVVDLVAGNTFRATIVLVVGLVLVGFVPDAVIRPRLAGGATDLPVSVYFVGFVGGLLTLGAIGFVVGPLVVALLAETVRLLSDGGATTQQRLPGSATAVADGDADGRPVGNPDGEVKRRSGR
ncbi:AI-2E family transporter [Halobaculum gomorrense]|uniref:Predicted PurR-regulated permease PerM n=1 Tax=Halobaculum gomorrense TaxID=43928 RepID=A0A1M5SWQ1_9EURY|nr:AI-2E family transporter [Halobaculum gomorrense]SHH42929.1 Predicted PurR-regulated permease PerM [Halobaculum gomorrense]